MAGGNAAGSNSSLAVDDAKAQVRVLERRTPQCQKLIKLKLQSTNTQNHSRALVDNLLQVVQGILKKLPSHNAATLEHYQQLV